MRFPAHGNSCPLPSSLNPLAQNDRGQIHKQQESQQNDDQANQGEYYRYPVVGTSPDAAAPAAP
jgi:hypothetical protein